eukprot:ctg_1797.g535
MVSSRECSRNEAGGGGIRPVRVLATVEVGNGRRAQRLSSAVVGGVVAGSRPRLETLVGAVLSRISHYSLRMYRVGSEIGAVRLWSAHRGGGAGERARHPHRACVRTGAAALFATTSAPRWRAGDAGTAARHCTQVWDGSVERQRMAIDRGVETARMLCERGLGARPALGQRYHRAVCMRRAATTRTASSDVSSRMPGPHHRLHLRRAVRGARGPVPSRARPAHPAGVRPERYRVARVCEHLRRLGHLAAGGAGRQHYRVRLGARVSTRIHSAPSDRSAGALPTTRDRRADIDRSSPRRLRCHRLIPSSGGTASALCSARRPRAADVSERLPAVSRRCRGVAPDQRMDVTVREGYG